MKIVGGRILIYLTLAREFEGFEVSYNPGNVVAADINENNVALAVFVNRRLHEIYRIETSIGRIVIAYSERRKRITSGRSTRDRGVRKAVRKLREKERKEDIMLRLLGLSRRSLGDITQPWLLEMLIGVRIEWLARLVRI